MKSKPEMPSTDPEPPTVSALPCLDPKASILSEDLPHNPRLPADRRPIIRICFRWHSLGTFLRSCTVFGLWAKYRVRAPSRLKRGYACVFRNQQVSCRASSSGNNSSKPIWPIGCSCDHQPFASHLFSTFQPSANHSAWLVDRPWHSLCQGRRPHASCFSDPLRRHLVSSVIKQQKIPPSFDNT